jgi:hypothetical protein
MGSTAKMPQEVMQEEKTTKESVKSLVLGNHSVSCCSQISRKRRISE